jgi:hypothetical protein
VPASGEWAGALAESPWVLAVLYAVTTIDGFFPPVPSESAVIGLAALPASRGGSTGPRRRSPAEGQRASSRGGSCRAGAWRST